jgi:putative transcriptional regulator
MSNDATPSPLGAEMVAGLSAFCDALESGVPVETRYTVRTVSLDLKAKPYAADDVKRIRNSLGASQAIFAMFLGVSVKTLRSWEQGTRPVPTIACRFMDEIADNRDLWTRRITQSTRSARSEASTSRD